MEEVLTDPWLYLTAFGFLASGALLIYLIGQFNAASETDDEILDETAVDTEPEPGAKFSDVEEDATPAPPPAPAAGSSAAAAAGAPQGEDRRRRPTGEVYLTGLREDLTRLQQELRADMEKVRMELIRVEEKLVGSRDPADSVSDALGLGGEPAPASLTPVAEATPEGHVDQPTMPELGAERRKLSPGEGYLNGLHEDIIRLQHELRADMEQVRQELVKVEDRLTAQMTPQTQIQTEVHDVHSELARVIEELEKVKNRLPPPDKPPPTPGDLSPFQ